LSSLMGSRVRTTQGIEPLALSDISRDWGLDQSLLPVFQQDWWLEVVRGEGNYNEARVLKDGVLVGRLPYVIRRTKIGARWGGAPDCSHLGGPALSQSLSEEEKFDVVGQLIAELPAKVSFMFVCRTYADDAELIRRAFTRAGFNHFAETTYCQDPSQADVLGRLKRKHRSHYEAARRVLDVVELGEEEFIGFYSANLARAAVAAAFRLETARALIAAGRTREPPQIRLVGARRKAAGPLLEAAIACAWDERRYYYWLSTRRGESHPNAIKLLIVNAMAHAQSLGLIFDTDGCWGSGSLTLYQDLLRMPKEEFRDVFERRTKFQNWYFSQQQRLDRSRAVRYAKRKLQLVSSGWATRVNPLPRTASRDTRPPL